MLINITITDYIAAIIKGWHSGRFPGTASSFICANPSPLIQTATPPCIKSRHNRFFFGSVVPSLSAASPASSSPPPPPCSGSPRCCLPCSSFCCRVRTGDTSPRSAGAPSPRSSLRGLSSRWSAATRPTLCRCSSEPWSGSTTRRTALRCG